VDVQAGAGVWVRVGPTLVAAVRVKLPP
jgi:hypothetical protein